MSKCVNGIGAFQDFTTHPAPSGYGRKGGRSIWPKNPPSLYRGDKGKEEIGIGKGVSPPEYYPSQSNRVPGLSGGFLV